MYDTIPAELRALRQWTYSYDEKELKRPTHYHYEPDGALTFEQAVERAGTLRSFGLYVTKEDPYILGDIDHVDDPYNPYPDLPIQLVEILRNYPTYMEASPSGRGVRFVYKLNSIQDKQVVSGFFFKNKIAMGEDSTGAKREAQINVGRPWQRFTGKKIPFASDNLANIDLSVFDKVFNLRQDSVKTKDLASRMVDTANLPSMSDVVTALNSLPLNQNPRIRRAYEATFLESYTHYQYWVKIMMAVHHYAEVTNKGIECLNAVIEWSKHDPTDYNGEEDVHKHWRSFSASEGFISYRSLFGVAAKYRLFWPRPKKRKENEPFMPMVTEYVNFKALMDYYAIRFFRDETNLDIIYITGDRDIIEKYFLMINVKEHYGRFFGPFSKDTLIPAVYMMCQDKGFIGLSHNITGQFIRTYLAEAKETINLIRYYFDTPFERLPVSYQINAENYHISTVEYLFSALEIEHSDEDSAEEEEKLYFAYYKSWLMGFVRNLYITDTRHMNNCILLLTGNEQIRKTSHFLFMFPKFMREKIALTPHGFDKETSMRDVIKLSANNIMIVWDEIEQYLTAETESNFKKIIDNNPQKIIDKYETIEKVITPIAIYGGTSNQRMFNLGNEGSRRLFNIPVKWVDTDLINSICWHRLINDLKTEMMIEFRKGRVPWLLTEEQLQLQRVYHARIRSKTTLEIVLEEVFMFEYPMSLKNGDMIPDVTSFQGANTRLLTTKDVCEILVSRGHGQHAARRPAVLRALTRLCAEYTNTQRGEVHISMPRCIIKRGEAWQGNKRRWVMPPVRTSSPGIAFQAYTN